MKIFAFAFASTLSLTALPTLATTLTVTFDDPDPVIVDGGYTAIGESQGFSYQTSTAYSAAADISLNDDGGLFESSISHGGAAFTPLSIDLWGLSNIYRTGAGPAPDPTESWDAFEAWSMEGVADSAALRLTGVRSSGPSVSRLFTGPFGSVETVAFGVEFAGITELVLTLVLPGDGAALPRYVFFPEDATGSSQDWCFEYCAAFHADNLVVTDEPLSPVPLAASGLVLLSGLGLLGMVARRTAG